MKFIKLLVPARLRKFLAFLWNMLGLIKFYSKCTSVYFTRSLLVLRAQGVDAGDDLECRSQLHRERHHEMFRFDQQQRLTIHLLHEELVGIACAPGNAAYEVAYFCHLSQNVNLIRLNI